VSTRAKWMNANRKIQCHRGYMVGEGGVGKCWWATSSSATRLIDVTWLYCWTEAGREGRHGSFTS
jgi:hypothetical protein